MWSLPLIPPVSSHGPRRERAVWLQLWSGAHLKGVTARPWSKAQPGAASVRAVITIPACSGTGVGGTERLGRAWGGPCSLPSTLLLCFSVRLPEAAWPAPFLSQIPEPFPRGQEVSAYVRRQPPVLGTVEPRVSNNLTLLGSDAVLGAVHNFQLINLPLLKKAET